MANILDTYGIKEVADVTMYEILDVTDKDYNTYGGFKPVLFLDTLKVSTIEQTASQTSARGGKGNPELIIWDFGKEITLNITDALFSPQSMNIMFGGMKAGKLATMTSLSSLNRMTKYVVKDTAHRSDLTIGTAGEKWYVGTDAGLTLVSSFDEIPDIYFTDSASKSVSTIKENTILYVEKSYNVTGRTIEITADNFPGTYRLVGETLARSQKTGTDEYFQFEVPKAKMGAENTITLEAEGDPTVFNMTMKVLRPDDGVMMKLTQFSINEAEPTPTPTTYTVTFDVTTNEEDLEVTGTAPAAQTVEEGGKATTPTNVTAKSGGTVVWKNGDTPWNFATDTVSANVTLVATVGE